MKKTQRQQLRAKRNAVTQIYQHQCSQQVCERIVQLPVYQQATHLALYRAVDREIVLDEVWRHACAEGKRCYFPKMMPNFSLCFLPATLDTCFVENQFGILEPEGDIEGSMDACHLFFLPLVGFNVEGGRLGSGAGYYDRFLVKHEHPYCVGVGYAFQECAGLLTEKTDYPLNLIVTEERVIEPKKRK